MRRRLVRGAAVLGIGCCVLLLGVYLWKSGQRSMAAAQQSACVGHLAYVSLALHEYHQLYGRFPPAYIADKDGKPMHSWRMLVLETTGDPDANAVFRAYRFDEPWDGPNNRKLADRMPRFYGCPVAEHAAGRPAPGKSLTNYVVVTGPGAVFRGGGAPSASLSELDDNHRDTTVLAETVPGVPWMEPRDLELDRMSLRLNDPDRPSISSKYPSSANVVFLDGRIHRLLDSVSPEAVKAMILAHPAAGNHTGAPKEQGD